jgi:predicted PurR-regulated permease PerM
MSPDGTPDPRLEGPPTRTSLLNGLLGFVLVGGLLYVGRAAFIPVALAVLLALLLSTPVEALHKKGVPRGVSALLVAVLFLAVVAIGFNFLWTPAQKWIAVAPQTVRYIERKMSPVARVIGQIDSVWNRAGHLASGSVAAPGANAPVVQSKAVSDVASPGLLSQTRLLLVGLFTTIMLTLFLLAGGQPMLARMTTALASYQKATHFLKVLGAVRSELARYYRTIALINLGLGVATALMTLAFGISNPLLWGVLAGVLNFLPYVGSAITLAVLTMVAFLTFEGLGPVFGVAICYLALATIEGQFVQPLFVGKRLELNPPIIFIALWFGGWFWGVAGIIVAIPSLIALKVAAEHHRHGAALVAFLTPGQSETSTPKAPPVDEIGT